MERKGAVAQVLGPVVDVVFPDGKLPEINEAMTVTTWGHPAGDGSGPTHRRRHRPLHHALPQ